jgi:hypothetical protein
VAGVGPGDLLGDPGRHEAKQRRVYMARMLKAPGGIPAERNTVPGWQPERCDHDTRMPAGHVR